MTSRHGALARHWLAKGLAGLVPGFLVALGASGLFALAGPDGPGAGLKYQVAMWLVPAVWMPILAFCFLFRDGWRAWAWLGGAAIALHIALAACRHGP